MASSCSVVISPLVFFEKREKSTISRFMPPSFYFFSDCFITDHLLFHASDIWNHCLFFFYNYGWMLYILGCDLHILVYFFSQLWMGAVYSQL